MLVRKMTLKDIPAVANIEKQCFSQPWSEKSFEDSITREDTIFLVCANLKMDEAANENSAMTNIVGYIGMYISFDEASITNVAVSPDFRKKGCGEQLVTAAKIAAKESLVNNIFLEVRASNVPAISLYKKMGFEELGLRKRFYEYPVEDAIIMKVGI